MNYKNLHKIVDDYFSNVTPEEVIKKLKALGCKIRPVTPDKVGTLTAQCRGCHRVLYDNKWLFGKMDTVLPNITQIECPDCISNGECIITPTP